MLVLVLGQWHLRRSPTGRFGPLPKHRNGGDIERALLPGHFLRQQDNVYQSAVKMLARSFGLLRLELWKPLRFDDWRLAAFGRTWSLEVG